MRRFSIQEYVKCFYDNIKTILELQKVLFYQFKYSLILSIEILSARTVSGQLPRRTIPHRTGFGPDEWFYSVVVVLVGSCPGGE